MVHPVFDEKAAFPAVNPKIRGKPTIDRHGSPHQLMALERMVGIKAKSP